MPNKNSVKTSDFIDVPFKIHPRVFAALGADLVTNDVVAIIELVKNAYDAFASSVNIKFGENDKLGSYIEILDNGSGMTEEIIKDVWCTVATPYRATNTMSKIGQKERRVSGEKGLGRLSVARLGAEMSMLTKSNDDSCWNVRVDWNNISNNTELSQCHVKLREYTGAIPFETTGTRIRIYKLKSVWNEETYLDLQDNLARLISPFSKINDFEISLSLPQKLSSETIKIESPEFLSKPKYLIFGNVELSPKNWTHRRHNI